MPGVQGAIIAGTHGAGPQHAITSGFVGAVHKPKGMIFNMGAKSMILPLGTLLSISVLPGDAINADGAKPNEHIIIAPVTTYESPIIIVLYSLFRAFVNHP